MKFKKKYKTILEGKVFIYMLLANSDYCKKGMMLELKYFLSPILVTVTEIPAS
jgi:hypothetical protein